MKIIEIISIGAMVLGLAGFVAAAHNNNAPAVVMAQAAKAAKAEADKPRMSALELAAREASQRRADDWAEASQRADEVWGQRGEDHCRGEYDGRSLAVCLAMNLDRNPKFSGRARAGASEGVSYAEKRELTRQAKNKWSNEHCHMSELADWSQQCLDDAFRLDRDCTGASGGDCGG
jgi:hypothetical protein